MLLEIASKHRKKLGWVVQLTYLPPSLISCYRDTNSVQEINNATHCFKAVAPIKGNPARELVGPARIENERKQIKHVTLFWPYPWHRS